MFDSDQGWRPGLASAEQHILFRTMIDMMVRSPSAFVQNYHGARFPDIHTGARQFRRGCGLITASTPS